MITLEAYVKQGGVKDAYVESEAIIALEPTIHGSVVTLTGGSQIKVKNTVQEIIKLKQLNAKTK